MGKKEIVATYTAIIEVVGTVDENYNLEHVANTSAQRMAEIMKRKLEYNVDDRVHVTITSKTVFEREAVN